MAQKVGIDVSADLDTREVEEKINALGRKIAEANKVAFTPFRDTSVQDLDRMVRQFDQLRRIQGELNRRMRETGQGDRSLIDADWSRLYPDPRMRDLRMRQAFEYATGVSLAPREEASRSDQRRQTDRRREIDRRPRPDSVSGVGVGVAQAGLSALGPAGGVAATALGTGMASGFGAGLMGLLGGMLALGVGKAVSAVMARVGQAEDNAVAYDRLKRVLGDVNVSFEGLKASVTGSAEGLRITYAEAAKLSTEFAKLGNLSAEQHGELDQELRTGVGLSRAFGLDPERGTSVLGQMRGIGVTTDPQESRRFALLIGETISRSDAFARADEVMGAMAEFATMQTRAGVGVANVGGFAGMYSAMTGSGTPGLDPAGTGALLMRVNAALSAGGAKGEASQFFSQRIGAARGLSPFQMQVFREGGAFATMDEAFGQDSVAHQYGMRGPSGDETFLQMTLDQLRQDYGHDPEMLAHATGQHLGVGIRQAMAMLDIKPNQMGEMMRYAPDLTGVSASGIGNMGKALFGSEHDRVSLANAMYRATGDAQLSEPDRARLDDAMQSGDAAVQREVLAQLAAQYGQERTQGADIRDSKNALDNIKTNIADKLIPLTLEMRHGIMSIAGVGKDGRTSESVMRSVIEADSSVRLKTIDATHDPDIAKLEDERDQLNSRIKAMSGGNLEWTYRDHPQVLDEKLAQREADTGRLEQINEELGRLNEKKEAAVQKELELKKAQLESMQNAIAHQADIARVEQRIRELQGQAKDLGDAPRYTIPGEQGQQESEPGVSGRFMGSRPEGVQDDTPDAAGQARMDALYAKQEARTGLPLGTLRAIQQIETGGSNDYLKDPAKYHYPLDKDGRRIAPHTGQVSTAFGPFGILESTARDPGYGVAPLKDKSPEEQTRFAAEYLAALVRRKGSFAGGLASYGEGNKYAQKVIKHIPKTISADQPGNSDAISVATPGVKMVDISAGTPIPAEGVRRAEQQKMQVGFDPATVHIVNAQGQPVAEPVKLNPIVGPARAFGG